MAKKKTHPNKGRNPLEHTGGKASARIREIYTATPDLPTKTVQGILAKEGLKCSTGLVSSVKHRMKKVDSDKIKGETTVLISQLQRIKVLANEMGVPTFKAMVALLYGVES